MLQGIGQIQKPAHGQLTAQFRQCLSVVQPCQQGAAALRGGFHNGHVPGEVAQLAQQRRHVLTAAVQLVKQRQRVAGALLQHAPHQLHRLRRSGKAQHLQHGTAVDNALHRPALIQQRQGVPHGAVGHPGQQLGPVGGQVDLLLTGDIQQLLLDIPGQQPLEGKALTAGENGGRHLVQLGGGQNKQQMLRRLLQDLQQRVERRDGQHVYLVDDIHPLFQHGGGVYRFLPQRADLIDAIVGSGVQFRHIQQRPVVDAPAGVANAAGRAVHGMLTVDGLGQNAGAGSLAGAPGAGEQIGVPYPALRHLPLQGGGDVGLSHYLGKCLGPPFAVQGLIHPAASFLGKGKKSPPHAAVEPAPSRHMSIPLNAARFPA